MSHRFERIPRTNCQNWKSFVDNIQRLILETIAIRQYVIIQSIAENKADCNFRSPAQFPWYPFEINFLRINASITAPKRREIPAVRFAGSRRAPGDPRRAEDAFISALSSARTKAHGHVNVGELKQVAGPGHFESRTVRPRPSGLDKVETHASFNKLTASRC